MTAAQWWVGAYTEAGAGTGAGTVPYLAFAFSAPDRAAAQAHAGAKLLAGPFGTQGQAEAWAAAYNTNPATVQAGSGLSPSTGTTTAGAGQPPGAGLLSGWTVGGISGTNLVIRGLKILIGAALMLIGLAHVTGAQGAVMDSARRAPLPA